MLHVPTTLDADALQDYDRLREGAAGVDLTPWALIELTGEDRKGWLQGQATNDVKRLTDGNSRAFCFCEPTGHILAAVDAWALPDRIVMTVPRELAQAVLERVERMTIMEDVAARELPWRGVSVQGPQATRLLGETLELPALDAGEGDGHLLLRSNRTGMGGWDVWTADDSEISARFPAVRPEAYEAARIEAGVPQWGRDMGPRTLPPELGAAFEGRNVSYNKGCYTGQEVLMRMHSRGHTNKTWVGLVAEVPFKVGTPVLYRGKEVGTIASAAPSPDYGFVGSATLRNEAAYDGEAVKVGETEAEVRRMPILRLE